MGGLIVPKINYSWPGDVANLPNAVTVTYQAGFGAKPSTIPIQITQAMLMAVADWYGPSREDKIRNLPKASEYLLLPWYRWAA